MFKNFLNTRFIGKQVNYLPKCHSTNDIAAGLVSGENYQPGQVIITDYQTAGRGQHGNTWDSEAGKNLMFSIILEPRNLEAIRNFFLGTAVNLGICDGLNAFIPGTRIKWPNDIYYEKKKLGGILVENTIRNGKVVISVAGIGINVNQAEFNLERAVSLRQILGSEVRREEVFEKIIYGIDSRYNALIEGEFELLKNEFYKVMYGYGRIMKFEAGNVFSGEITGIDDSGRLTVKTEGENRVFDRKQITFLD